MMLKFARAILHRDVIESEILHEKLILSGEGQFQHSLNLRIIFSLILSIALHSFLDEYACADDLLGNLLACLVFFIGVDSQA